MLARKQAVFHDALDQLTVPKDKHEQPETTTQAPKNACNKYAQNECPTRQLSGVSSVT